MNDPNDIDGILRKASEPPEDGALMPEAPVTQPSQEVTPADSGVLDVTGAQLGDFSEEDRAREDEARQIGVVIPDPPSPPEVPLQNPLAGSDPAEIIRETIERQFSGDVEGIGKIVVTPEERIHFLRCGLDDSEVQFSVELDGLQMTVVVAIPPPEFTVSVTVALDEWAKQGFVDRDSNMQWLGGYHQLHMLYQVRSVNGQPTDWWDRPAGESWASVRKFLANPESVEVIRNVKSVRWTAFMRAMLVAEHKYKICTDRLNDRTFFSIAGTA